MKHKKVILLILGLMLSLCLFFGISYAFWLKENTQDIKNIANSGCFNLSLTEETSAININNLYPIKDEESTNLTPYTFTLKNTCNYNAYYEQDFDNMAKTVVTRLYGSDYVLSDEVKDFLLDVIIKELTRVKEAHEQDEEM